MRILVASGAPRRDGYTEELVRLFADGAAAAGGQVELLRLAERDVRPCRGCFRCWSGAQGRCAIRDDMDEILGRVLAAEALVLATPVYFYSFSALLKAFVERLLPASLPFIDTSAASGMERNTPREPGRGPRRIALIAVGAHRDPRLMDGLVATFETICHGMCAERAGVLRRPESFLLDFAEGKPLPIEKIRAAFAAAGRELVTEGRVRPETERDAATALTRDVGMFAGHARAYWEIARRDGAGGYDRQAVRERAAADPRILAPELAACLDPAAAGDLEATIQFSIEGVEHGEFHLVIAGGACAARPGRHPAPDAALAMDHDTFMALVRGREDARALAAGGRIRASGDRAVYARLGRLFARGVPSRAG